MTTLDLNFDVTEFPRSSKWPSSVKTEKMALHLYFQQVAYGFKLRCGWMYYDLQVAMRYFTGFNTYKSEQDFQK